MLHGVMLLRFGACDEHSNPTPIPPTGYSFHPAQFPIPPPDQIGFFPPGPIQLACSVQLATIDQLLEVKEK